MTAKNLQPGNPRGLTRHGHVLPKMSIRRFVGLDGQVQVWRTNGRQERHYPQSKLFCADRAWDQRSEAQTERYERTFQELAARVLQGDRGLSDLDHQAVTRFYSLCELRRRARADPQADLYMRGCTPSPRVLTDDEQEIFESRWTAFDIDNVMPGRFFEGIRIQLGLDRLYDPSTRWGVVESPTIDLLVPDSFGGRGVVPVGPNVCLVASVENGVFRAEEAIKVNLIALSSCTSYCFARDFSQCAVSMPFRPSRD